MARSCGVAGLTWLKAVSHCRFAALQDFCKFHRQIRRVCRKTARIATMEANIELDVIDRRILRALQTDGRITYDVLAAQVSLSPSATLRRVKRLEDAGVIAAYVALVPPERVGLGLTAYLNVRLEKHAAVHKRNPMDLFRASVQTWPEVVECAALTGEMDYLLRVVVQDMAHYTRFIMETLLKHPSVEDLQDQLRARPCQEHHGRAGLSLLVRLRRRSVRVRWLDPDSHWSVPAGRASPAVG